MHSNAMQAKIECIDLLVRVKEAIIAMAIDTLHKELESKRIEINDKNLKIPERIADPNSYLYIINSITSNEAEMARKYEAGIAEIEKSGDREKAARIDELRKSLMAIRQISILSMYWKIMDPWIQEIGASARGESASELIIHSIDSERAEAIKFAASSKAISKLGILSKEDTDLLHTIIASVDISGNLGKA